MCDPSRNQWPYFGVPKERSFVRLTHERFYFLKLNLKINSVLLMLKRIFFCTFLLLVIYRVSCYNLSLLFVCYHNIHIQGKTVKNCSEIDWTLSFNSFISRNQNKQPCVAKFCQKVSEINVNCLGRLGMGVHFIHLSLRFKLN